MKKIIQLSSNLNGFFPEDCQFSPSLNMHFEDTPVDRFLMVVSSKIRHTPAASQPPLSRGELPGSSFVNRLFVGIPSREGGLLRRIDGGGGVC
jgi:hypothetical protein